VAIFFLALMPQFVDPAAGPVALQILVLGALMAVLGLAIDSLYALGAGALGSWLRARTRAARRQRYFTGGVYLVLGAAAAPSGERRTGR
jgi:threonine/homoserine/homoserine lactone efflux protein